MKKQLLILCVAFAATVFYAGNVSAQWAPKETYMCYYDGAPTIDGDSSEWANVHANAVDVPYATEVVTFQEGKTGYFKAVWNDTAIFVLVSCPDDDYYPSVEAGVASWLADKPEIYFDVNATIVEDGVTDNGPDNGNSGHFQWAPTLGDPVTNVSYMYQEGLDTAAGTSYFVEYAVGLQFLKSRAGDALSPAEGLVIGFDVTFIDLDEGVGTAIQRIDWSNDVTDTRDGGVAGESWASMDASGAVTITEKTTSVKNVNYDSKAIYPSVTSDVININVDASNIAIVNSIGQTVKVINSNVNVVDVAELPEGIYFVTLKTKDGNFTSKFLKR